MPFPTPPYFPYLYPRKKGRKMDYRNLAEEELKLRIAEQFFPTYDCAHRIGKIDFTVAVPMTVGAQHATPCAVRTQRDASEIPTTEFQSLLWAEAKRGIVGDIYKPLVQLVLTIGRARTFDTYLPPPFLGVFDAEKIVFLPYKEIMPFFTLNDFNWNVTPSDDSTREFGLLYEAIRVSLALQGARPVRATSGQGGEHTGGTSCRVAGVARYAPTKDHSVDNARRSRKGVACSAPTDPADASRCVRTKHRSPFSRRGVAG